MKTLDSSPGSETSPRSVLVPAPKESSSNQTVRFVSFTQATLLQGAAVSQANLRSPPATVPACRGPGTPLQSLILQPTCGLLLHILFCHSMIKIMLLCSELLLLLYLLYESHNSSKEKG